MTVNRPARLAALVPQGTIGTTLALLARIGLQSLTFIVISRELGAGGYGLLVGVVAIAMVVAPLSSLGVEFIMLRTIALDQAGSRTAIGTSLLVVCALGPICAGIAWLLCDLMLSGVSFDLLWPIIIADVMLGPMVDVCWRAFQGADQMSRAALMRLVPAATRCIAALLFVLLADSDSGQVWATFYLASSVLATVASLAVASARFGRFRIDLSKLRDSLGQSWHFASNVLTERVTNDADKFLLASLGGPVSAGVYGAGYRLVEILTVPVASLVLSANARAFRAGASGPHQTGSVIRRLLYLVLAYGVCAGIVLWLSARFAPLLLGTEFSETNAVISALALLPLLYGVRSSLWLGLAATGCHRFRTISQWVVASFNIVANLMLIPALGWGGAAISTLGSETLLAALFAWRLRAVHLAPSRDE